MASLPPSLASGTSADLLTGDITTTECTVASLVQKCLQLFSANNTGLPRFRTLFTNGMHDRQQQTRTKVQGGSGWGGVGVAEGEGAPLLLS